MDLRILIVILTLVSFIQAKDVQSRIYNGKEVKKGEEKHLVKIEGPYLCSGSIVGATWVVTAAHCVYKIEMKHVLHHSKPRKYIAKIYTSYSHPQYNSKPRFDTLPSDQTGVDIAVAKTSEIKFDQYIQPISLVTKTPNRGEKAMIAGYGRSNVGLVTTVPLHGKVKIRKCPKYLGVTNDVLCGNSHVSPGQGDSGGPVATKNGLSGVISATQCDDDDDDGVSGECYWMAVDVAAKLDWIKSVMET